MRVLRFDSGSAEYFEDEVVEDQLVKIKVNGVLFAEVMAYDEFLDDLAVGHLKTGNIINDLDDIVSLTWSDYVVDMQLRDRFDPVFQHEQWYGLLEHVCRDEELLIDDKNGLDRLTPDDIFKVMDLLNESGEIFMRTGGTHSALIYQEDAGYVYAEDIGRLNALDKAVGLAMRKGLVLGESILASSGRLSGEMVLKAAYAGVPVMCSVSAPMLSGIRVARAAGMSLLGFVRGERFNVYAGFKRISS